MTTHGADRSTILDEGRTSNGLSKGGNKGKLPITKTVGKTDECDKSDVLIGACPGSTDMDYDGYNPYGIRGVQRDRLSGCHIVGLCINNEQQVTGHHRLA